MIVTNDLPAVPVVCAIIEQADNVLVAQRPVHKHLPLKWEFPGGKVEPGESPAAALLREIREELGCDLIDLQALPACFHEYPTVRIHMLPFVARLQPGTTPPEAREHVAIQWLPISAVAELDLAPADYPVITLYRRFRGFDS